MFTGIIETTGLIKSVQKRMDRFYLEIEAQSFLHELQEGGSIAIDGICLTVTGINGDIFNVDVIKETLSKTTIPTFRVGTRVNLEKPLRFSDRLDGHFVQGHVDGIAKVVRQKESRGNVVMTFRFPKDLLQGVVRKGSVAIDGISLTVAEVRGENVSVALIPYTLKNTTLGSKKIGDTVNVETDIVGKYVAQHFRQSDN